jgi:hypothetical protein
MQEGVRIETPQRSSYDGAGGVARGDRARGRGCLSTRSLTSSSSSVKTTWTLTSSRHSKNTATGSSRASCKHRKPPVCRPCGRPQHTLDIVCGPDLCPTWQGPDPRFAIAPPFIPPEPAERACPDCRQTAWWTRADSGEVCGLCYPAPHVLEWSLPSQESPMT